MKIVVGSDHGGVNLKNEIVKHLQSRSDIEITDVGPNSTQSVDYPSYALEVSKQTADNKVDYGILCCGTGIGMSITANKVHGVRASAVTDCFSAEATRAHNNANVLCLGERIIGVGLALNIVDIWLSTEFEGGRHSKRLDKVADIERDY